MPPLAGGAKQDGGAARGDVALAGFTVLRSCRCRGALELIDNRVTAPSGPSIPRPGPPGQADAMRRMIGSISALGAAAGTGKIVAV